MAYCNGCGWSGDRNEVDVFGDKREAVKDDASM